MKNSRTNNVLWSLMLLALLGLVAGALFFWQKPDVAEDEATPPAAANTGRVAFLMEQQWLVRLKLAKVEEAMRAPQIQSTGRIVPVPS
ncbi:MAG TPA: hypothetical protein VFR18_14160, partial [Terriglobia bacterium]|nr:hypothetical protein [Terriglobia bacterium]